MPYFELHVGQKGTSFKEHFTDRSSHHFAINCNSYFKGCNLASRDYLPQFVESLGAQEKSESAQCSVSMRECFLFVGGGKKKKDIIFLLLYNPWLVCMCIYIKQVGTGSTF